MSTDAKTISKACGKLVLSVDPVVYHHIRNQTSAKAVWDKLKSVYDDRGLTKKVTLLRNLTTPKLENCASMEEYVNQVTSTVQKLEGIDMQIPDELIGAILLAGLPGEYRPMIMALEHSGTNITADLVITKLLQGLRDTDYYNQNAQGFFTYGPRMPKRPFSKFKRRGQTHAQSQSRVRCYKCN